MSNNKTAEEFVQKFIDSHEPDTFVKNEYGTYMYSAGASSINLKSFMADLLMDYEDSRQSEIDQLNKEVERLRDCGRFVLREYIRCVNDNDEITEKLEELINQHNEDQP